MSDVSDPIEYVVARIHEALIRDERLCEQAIEVLAIGDRIVVRGHVATADRHRLALIITHERAEGHPVVDDISSATASPTVATEIL